MSRIATTVSTANNVPTASIPSVLSVPVEGKVSATSTLPRRQRAGKKTTAREVITTSERLSDDTMDALKGYNEFKGNLSSMRSPWDFLS